MSKLPLFNFVIAAVLIVSTLGLAKPGADFMHSFAGKDVEVLHMDLDLKIDFDSQKISGWAGFQIKQTGKSNQLILDTKDLTIKSVSLKKRNKKASYQWGEKSDLGKALVVDLKPNTEWVWVEYESSPNAEALQWLKPEQTADKKLPFLYSQGQTIFTRTWIPCQDTPARRVTYTAKISVNNASTVLMAADKVGEVEEDKGWRSFRFEMKQPIPTYLIALAAGDLKFEKIGDRAGVWAEPSMVKKAAKEFADTEKMMNVAEDLYGSYRWGRYDVLVLPPSFPFGGMENPKLTFVNPTTIVGDQSLVSIISHELAHSWSGNLVTNRSWEDFWLNEGTTTYIERRILEAMYGERMAELDAHRGHQAMWKEIGNKKLNASLKKLKTNLSTLHPEDSFLSLPYEKGYWFWKDLEAKVGRPALDRFLRKYFSEKAFDSISTEQFEAYVSDNLLRNYPKAEKTFALKQWLYQAKAPENAVSVESKILTQVYAERKAFLDGEKTASQLNTKSWSWVEWAQFFDDMPQNIETHKLFDLYKSFKLASLNNSEILAPWFEVAIANNYTPAYPKLEAFLMDVGRLKFIVPLYKQLQEYQPERAKSIFEKARAGYHPMSQKAIEDVLKTPKS